MPGNTISFKVDRGRILQKWKPVLEKVFENVKYLLPYVEEEIAYQIEVFSYNEQIPAFLTPLTPPPSLPNGFGQDSKLPQFVANIKVYLEDTIPDYYMDNIEVGLNPFSGQLVYKYKGELLNLKDLQKAKIDEYLSDIDFYSIFEQLYDTDAKTLLRKKKLEKLK